MTTHGTISITKNRDSNIMMFVLLGSAVLMAITAYWNWFAPEADYWPQLVGDIITILPAVGAAIAGALLVRQFERGEKPRAIWFWFALGWWAWVVGEIVSLSYDVFSIPYGDLSVYDIFWVAGYLCFGLSLFFQYRSIYSDQKQFGLWYFGAVVVFILLATLGFTEWALVGGLGEGISFFALYLAVFYPVCDLAAGVTAVWLAFLFGRGTWGRPWWSLIVFAIADGINIFLWIGGDRILPEKVALFLDPLSSTIYNLGYVAAMLGFLFILALNFWPALGSTHEGEAQPAQP
jgi:hypothetical protein